MQELNVSDWLDFAYVGNERPGRTAVLERLRIQSHRAL